MLFAFSSAKAARVSACTQLGADEFPVGGGDATDDPGGSETDIRTIEISADAGHLLGNLFFSQASVCAGVARLGTRIAGSDALDGARVIARWFEGMRFEHLFNVTHE